MVDAMTDDIKSLSLAPASDSKKPVYVETATQKARISELAAAFKLSRPTKEQMLELGIMLGEQRTAPINAVAREGLISVFVRFLKDEELGRSASFCMANVTSGSAEVQSAVLESGALMTLLSLMVGGCGPLQQNATWAIANLLGEKATSDVILATGAVQMAVSMLFKQKLDVEMRRIASWALCNLTRTESMALDTSVRGIVLNALETEVDGETLSNLLLTARRAAKDAAFNAAFIARGIVKRVLVPCVDNQAVRGLACHACDMCANIAGDSDLRHAQALIDAGLIPKLASVAISPACEHGARLGAFITLANVGSVDLERAQVAAIRAEAKAAGLSKQLQSVIDTKILERLPALFHGASAGCALYLETLQLVGAVATNGTPQQLSYAVVSDMVPYTCTALAKLNAFDSKDGEEEQQQLVDSQLRCLDILRALLEHDETDTVISQIEASGGRECIEACQHSTCDTNARLASSILKEFWVVVLAQ